MTSMDRVLITRTAAIIVSLKYYKDVYVGIY